LARKADDNFSSRDHLYVRLLAGIVGPQLSDWSSEGSMTPTSLRTTGLIIPLN